MSELPNFQKTLPVTKTICRDCVFACSNTTVFDDTDGSSSWCAIQKLDNNRATWNKEDQYWSLDYFCNHCRNVDWVKKHKLEYAPDSALLEKIREENKVISDIILLVHSNHLLEDIERVLDKMQSKYIGKVIVSINNTKIRPSAINKLLNKYKLDWQITIHMNDSSVREQVYKTHKYTKGMFSIIVDKFTHYDDSLPETLDKLVNDANEKFVYFETDEGITNLVVHNILYSMLGTFDRDTIIKFAEDQECQHMLKLKQ